jgi:N-acetylglucosamine kinase-like BadF-type ATPase
MRILLGIDAGGSKSTLIAVDEHLNELYRDSGPAIHARMMPLDDQVAGVTRLVETLRISHPEWDINGLCLGVAGGGRAFEQERLTDALNAIYPDWTNMVTSDAHIAHADAFDNGDGILVITGTGSMVLGRSGTRWERAGGYGFIIGDPAGGYRLGQESLFAICTAFDGGENTFLTGLLAKEFDIRTRDALIQKVYDNELVPAKLAPLLLDAAEHLDPVSVRILEQNTSRLADQIATCSQALGLNPTSVSVIGGLFNNDTFREHVMDAVSNRVSNVAWSSKKTDPALGACRMIFRSV